MLTSVRTQSVKEKIEVDRSTFKPSFQVKVMLRIGPSFPGETGSFMKVDQKRKQVTLYDPSTVGHVSQTHRKMGVAAPKMFAFDSIFETDCSQVSKNNYLV